MTSILLIADQPRLHALILAAANLSEAKFRVANSLNKGLEEITAETPSLLFVQSRLSGLSGEIIARHYKKELQGESTTIILFVESASDAGAKREIADITLSQAAPDKELSEKIREIIARQESEVRQQAPIKGPVVTLLIPSIRGKATSPPAS